MRGKVGARDAKGGDELRGTARKKVFAKGRFLGREDVRDSERGRISGNLQVKNLRNAAEQMTKRHGVHFEPAPAG